MPGITEPVHDSLLSASVAGTVQKINFKEGDAVQAGTVILELDKALEELERQVGQTLDGGRADQDRIAHESHVKAAAAWSDRGTSWRPARKMTME